MATANSKSVRIETHVSPEVMELIERAARYSGRSLSEFVISHVETAARHVVAGYERVKLDQEQSLAMADLLINPQSPNQKLQEAMAEHRIRVESR